MLLTIISNGRVGMTALCLTYLIENVMFPTIFLMALTDVTGNNTKTASSYSVMSIMGGAIIPILMGVFGETDMAFGFLVPLALLCGHNALRILLQATYIQINEM